MSSEGVWENLRLMRHLASGLEEGLTPGARLSDCHLNKHRLINPLWTKVSERSKGVCPGQCPDNAPSTLLNPQNFANTIGKPLREFRVDGAQTPLTGHLPPPPHRVGAPQATGGVLQIGEPSMDGVRHEGPPAPPAEHGGSQPRCLQRECGERRKRCLYGRSWYFPMGIDPQYHPSLFWDNLKVKGTPHEMTLLLRCALPGAEGRGVSATCLSLPPAQLLGVRTSSAAKA